MTRKIGPETFGRTHYVKWHHQNVYHHHHQYDHQVLLGKLQAVVESHSKCLKNSEKVTPALVMFPDPPFKQSCKMSIFYMA